MWGKRPCWWWLGARSRGAWALRSSVWLNSRLSCVLPPECRRIPNNQLLGREEEQSSRGADGQMHRDPCRS
eukprot:scaffold110880_cov35-Phaeocystis_antarctica.AAC.2